MQNQISSPQKKAKKQKNRNDILSRNITKFFKINLQLTIKKKYIKNM